MIENGFVKLPRGINERSWFTKPNTLQLYVVLLLNAAFKDIECEGYTIHAGQYVTSRSKLMEMTGLTERQTKTALNHLKASGDIIIAYYPKFSIITLNNYPCHQSDVQPVVRLGVQQDVQQNVHRSRSKEEVKEELQEEVEEGRVTASGHTAACVADYSSPSVDNSFSSDKAQNAPGRAELVDTYGRALVELYENKFRVWASAKNAVNVPMYATIAKWLAQDKVPKASAPSSPKPHIDTDRLRKAVMAKYLRNS